jgi:ferredoxin-NADP reductase
VTDEALPPLPSLDSLPPLPSIGPVVRRPPVGGARRQWQTARVVEIRDETPTAKTFRLALPAGTGQHVPGQHYDVRLTAPDGSTAQRSYSIASAPGRPGPGEVYAELSVERIADGDVSPYLHENIHVGDTVEVRGPFGGWFIWHGQMPVLLIGGGSGVVPLMAMRRYWISIGQPVPLRLVVSVRTPDDLFYPGEYGPETTVVYTRRAPDGDPRTPGRLSAQTVKPLVDELPAGKTAAYVCGSAGFAEHASQLLVDLGMEPSSIRVERFGPS